MHFVRVLVGEASYHGSEALTYDYSRPLKNGALVLVPLRDKTVVGVVVGTTNKPRFAVKDIIDAPPLPPMPQTLLALLEWIQNYYPAPLGIITQLFLPRTLPKSVDISTTTPMPEADLPSLTTEQTAALEKINRPGLHLLHGETGSGKTRIYIELAKDQLKRGHSSLILSPEIGLTSQLVHNFVNVFGPDRVVLVHSELGVVERREIWGKILVAKQPLVIIGARSALFSPIAKLGLIVVDESHEPAYKQDQAPHYHASVVAAQLGRLHNAVILLGSATPLVADYFVAETKNRPIIRMKGAATQSLNAQDHNVEIIDLRNKQLFTKSSFMSNALLDATQASLDNREQILIFLNRRGTARLVFCDQCAWRALCPYCDLPMVYHSDSHNMRCHSCGYRGKPPTYCPECGNSSIIFTALGTKAIEEEVRRLFPGARISRFDTDNKRTDRIEAQYQAIRGGSVDILVGTQTLAKGLDLPKLSLVGVIAADTSLTFPDFSAQERTFQLITQVLGRVGRGHRSTKAIIQTYTPDSELLRAILQKDWRSFYNKELAERKKFFFPPFCYQLKIVCRRASKAVAEQAAQALATAIAKQFPMVTVEGPASAFREKIQNKYQWQIIIKSTERSALLKIIKILPANCSYDIDPLNLL